MEHEVPSKKYVTIHEIDSFESLISRMKIFSKINEKREFMRKSQEYIGVLTNLPESYTDLNKKLEGFLNQYAIEKEENVREQRVITYYYCFLHNKNQLLDDLETLKKSFESYA